MNQRHRDLNTNELEKLVASAKPWLDEHGNKLIYAACAAMLIFALYYYVTQTSAVQREAGWSEFIAASEIEDYANIAARFKDSPPGQWALLAEANEHLDQGIRASFSDREGAISDLESAKAKYQELLKISEINPDLEERALFGLARCLESLSDKDTSKAIEAYESFLKKFPDSIFKEVAEEQLDSLTAEQGQEFYAWFHAQDPQPTSPSTPFGNMPEGHPPVDPGSLIQLPEIPEMLKLPEESAPAFPEGIDVPENGTSTPPEFPEPNDPNADADSATPEGTAPPVPENP